MDPQEAIRLTADDPEAAALDAASARDPLAVSGADAPGATAAQPQAERTPPASAIAGATGGKDAAASQRLLDYLLGGGQ